MGVYYYTYRKGIKPKKAIISGVEIQVGIAKFAASHGYIYGMDGMHPRNKAKLTRAENILQEEQADYIVFEGFDGYPVYKSNKRGCWCDTPMWSGISHEEDLIGYMYKIKGKYHVVPKGVSINEFMEKNFPKLYNSPLRSTQVYVKIHQGYTATVRDMKSFKDYVFGFGSDQPKYGVFQRQTPPEDVPTWFDGCVREVVEQKNIELRESLDLKEKGILK